MTAHGNLVAGQGASGAEAFRHVRPSSLDDVVGEYTRAGAAEQGRYAVAFFTTVKTAHAAP